MHAEYLTSASSVTQIPQWAQPQVVMMGRSNSGKSSLINALFNQKAAARVSATPGRTQMINFFAFSRSKTEKLVVADLPGWGYHKTSSKIQGGWEPLITTYLEVATNIQDIFVLTDVRRPLDEYECDYFKQLTQRYRVSLIMTKTDKLKAKPLKEAADQVVQSCLVAGVKLESAFLVSSLTKNGIEELREFLFRHVTPSGEPADAASPKGGA
jgi:GTP-binding protein